MDVRIGVLLFVIVLSTGGFCSSARHMAENDHLFHERLLIPHILGTQMKDQEQIKGNQVGNEQVCTLCEEYVSQALDYLTENKTQTEIVDALHQACSRLHTFKQQCTTLVDYYAPLFFLEVSSVQPVDFCQKVNLCEKIVFISSKFKEDRCGICHRAVSEVLIKLKDPDTQLEIIELLLKACDSMENHAAKCKKMVFEYGPIMLTNAEQFLESQDICTMFHACYKAQGVSGEGATVLKADS